MSSKDKYNAQGAYRTAEAKRIRKHCIGMLGALGDYDHDLTRQESMNLWVINKLLFNMLRRRAIGSNGVQLWPGRWERCTPVEPGTQVAGIEDDSPGEQPGA